MVGNGADKMCRIILIIILHHVTFQESLETAKNECMYRWLVNVLCQKRRKACQETVWERLTIYELLRNSELQTGLTNLVFEEVAEWLNDLFEINIIRKSSDIVVGFDHCGFSAETTLYNVRINQNHAADETVKSFVRIAQKNDMVYDEAGRLSELVRELNDANQIIVEGIHTISGVTEEVTAHSTETLKVSEDNSAITKDVGSTITGLKELAEQLKGLKK